MFLGMCSILPSHMFRLERIAFSQVAHSFWVVEVVAGGLLASATEMA